MRSMIFFHFESFDERTKQPKIERTNGFTEDAGNEIESGYTVMSMVNIFDLFCGAPYECRLLTSD